MKLSSLKTFLIYKLNFLAVLPISARYMLFIFVFSCLPEQCKRKKNIQLPWLTLSYNQLVPVVLRNPSPITYLALCLGDMQLSFQVFTLLTLTKVLMNCQKQYQLVSFHQKFTKCWSQISSKNIYSDPFHNKPQDKQLLKQLSWLENSCVKE